MNIILEPKVTLISRPTFIEPNHLRVKWGMWTSSDGERLVEYAGRLCYMSQANLGNKTTVEYLEHIISVGHGSVIEHANYSLLLEGISRSCSHELVRHRAGFAYSQLSQRYVDESDVAFVVPPAFLELVSKGEPTIDDLYTKWDESCSQSLVQYRALILKLEEKYKEKYETAEAKTFLKKMVREAARSVLPNSTETKMVVTANARAWRTMLELRCSPAADQEIRRLALVILNILQLEAPGFFKDFVWDRDDPTYAAPKYHKV